MRDKIWEIVKNTDTPEEIALETCPKCGKSKLDFGDPIDEGYVSMEKFERRERFWCPKCGLEFSVTYEYELVHKSLDVE